MKLAIEKLELNKRNYQELKLLIETKEDIELFLNEYWRGKDKVFFAIQKFRQDKLRSSDLSFEEFESLYNQDKTEALQKLFKHTVHKQDVKFLEQKIHNGEITLKELYDLHKEEPTMNMMRFLL
jgi:hypothetical protein